MNGDVPHRTPEERGHREGCICLNCEARREGGKVGAQLGQELGREIARIIAKAQKPVEKVITRAIRAAQKKLPFVAERKLEKRLDDMPLTPAEIYVLGAEEAQGEIIRRLQQIALDDLGPAPGPKEPPRPKMKEVG